MHDAIHGLEFSGESQETAPLLSGHAVCCSNRNVLLASAVNPSLVPCVGLVKEITGQNFRPVIVHAGFFTMPDWTHICGTPFLASCGKYFLSTSPGRLTLDSNESGARVCQLVGKAMSPIVLQLLLWDPILL